MLRLMKAAALAAALALCGACSTLGVDAETPNQRMVVIEYGYQAALQTIDNQVRAGTLKGERAAQVLRLLDAARAALTVARTATAAGQGTAPQAIAAASAALAVLVTYLNQRQPAARAPAPPSARRARPPHNPWPAWAGAAPLAA